MKKFIRKACLALTCSLVLFASTCFAALAPMPMAIGASDGEWTYLGRFISQKNYPSILEWETRMTQYTGSAEANELYDVYFYHSHYGNGDGQGCYVAPLNDGKTMRMGFACVLKLVPLDRNGRPEKISGGPHGIHLLSMSGASKGAFSARIIRVRTFDSVTHQLLLDVTHKQNPNLNGKFNDFDYNVISIKNNSPFYKAMNMTTCPTGEPLPY